MWIILGTIAITLATIAVGVVVDRRFPLLPRAKQLAAPPKQLPPYSPGAAPATALRVPADRLDKLVAGQRCEACRGPCTVVPDTDDRVRYADRELRILRLQCLRCGVTRPLYVDVVGS